MLKALLRAGVVNALWWCNRRSDQSRKRTWNGERSTPRGSMFGSGHGISGPVHDLLRTIPYHIYTCSKTLPDVKEEIMVKTASW